MDKKLILNIGNIEYTSKKSQTANSLEELKKDIKLLPDILNLFENINIEKLKIDGNEFKIILNDNDLYLDNKFINIASKFDVSSKLITFDLYSLYLKDIDLVFDGKIKIDYFNEKLNYFGNSYYEDLQTNLNVEMTRELVKFYLFSEPFKNLNFLKKYLHLPQVAEEWMYDNVQGNMKLDNFYGEYDLVKNQLKEDSLKGNAHIKNAKIRFHKNVDEVLTKSINVSFDNDKLHFDLIEPKFKNKDISGSYVTINNLTSELNGEVDVFIQTNDKLDKDVLNILKAYKINLPIIQKSGSTKAKLLMKFPYHETKSMITKGEFIVNDAEISINKFLFKSKNALVFLNDNNIQIKDADFKYKNMINALVNLNLDTKTLKSSGDALINSFLIKKDDGEKIVEIKNKKTSLDLDFNKEPQININDLETKININDLINVNIDNLSKIYPYSNLLKDLSIKDGNIFLAIKDDKDIKFNANLKGLDLPIQKEGKKVEQLDIEGYILDKNIAISTLNRDMKLEIKDEINLLLKNFDISIDTKKQKNNFNKNINVKLENSNLKVDEENYELKKADISINNDEISFNVLVKNPNIPLKKNDKNIDELELFGTYKKDLTTLNTKNNDLILQLKNDIISLDINGYDFYYSTKEKIENTYKNISLIGKNSSIVIDEKKKILADNYEIRLRENSKYISLKHEYTDISIKESEDKKIEIFANNINDNFINSMMGKQIIKGGNILFVANGTINNLHGKINIENSEISDLAILNNLLIFIHTSPALINPFFALPSVVGMATNSGFTFSSYKVVNGIVEFDYSKEKEEIDINKFLTIGNGIDFDGKGKINLNDFTLDSEVNLIFLKDYSKIVGLIPVVNYLLLGENNRVETLVNISGDINNPQISTNLTKDTVSIPVNIAKRIFFSPSILLDYVDGKNEAEKEKVESEFINKPLK